MAEPAPPPPQVLSDAMQRMITAANADELKQIIVCATDRLATMAAQVSPWRRWS